MPKWQNFAKSGYTGNNVVNNSNFCIGCFVQIVPETLITFTSSMSSMPSTRSTSIGILRLSESLSYPDSEPDPEDEKPVKPV